LCSISTRLSCNLHTCIHFICRVRNHNSNIHAITREVAQTAPNPSHRRPFNFSSLRPAITRLSSRKSRTTYKDDGGRGPLRVARHSLAQPKHDSDRCPLGPYRSSPTRHRSMLEEREHGSCSSFLWFSLQCFYIHVGMIERKL
jgi:hypothetical protein